MTDFKKLKVADLKQMLADKGLSGVGKKDVVAFENVENLCFETDNVRPLTICYACA